MPYKVVLAFDLPNAESAEEAYGIGVNIINDSRLFWGIEGEVESFYEIAFTPGMIDKLAEHAIEEHKAGRTRNLREIMEEYGEEDS